MTGMLAFCRCGHVDTEHRAGVGCTHVNRANAKRQVGEAVCACTRFGTDERMRDAEEFLLKQLRTLIAKERLGLEPVDCEDLLQVMRVSLWKASKKYDSRSHIRFGSFAAFEVYNDALDELRSARMFGRQGQHRLPPPAPSDPDGDGNWNFEKRDPLDELDDDAAGSRRLERAVAQLSVDAEDVGSLSLGWALAAADRVRARPARQRRSATHQSAAGRARRTGWLVGLDASIAVQHNIEPSTKEAAA